MALEILSFILLALTLISFTHLFWWFNVLDFFRLQYACFALLLFGIALLQFSMVLCVVNALTIALNLYRIRYFLPQASPKNTHQNKTILSVNAFKDNIDLQELRDVIDDSDPDVLLIMEMVNETKDALGDSLGSYTHKIEAYVRDGFRICLLSKMPLKEPRVSKHGPHSTPLLHAQIEIDGRDFQFFCAHPKPALNRRWHAHRRLYFRETRKIIAASDLPVIVLGDFNAVPWEREFQLFLKHANLRSTLQGHGYRITWPVFFPVLGVPMDHILITQGEAYHGLHVGPYAGSDHYPISVKIGSLN